MTKRNVVYKHGPTNATDPYDAFFQPVKYGPPEPKPRIDKAGNEDLEAILRQVKDCIAELNLLQLRLSRLQKKK